MLNLKKYFINLNVLFFLFKVLFNTRTEKNNHILCKKRINSTVAELEPSPFGNHSNYYAVFVYIITIIFSLSHLCYVHIIFSIYHIVVLYSICLDSKHLVKFLIKTRNLYVTILQNKHIQQTLTQTL